MNEREKKIIIVILAIAIIFCAFWFGYRNITAANENLDSEIASLRNEYNNLKIMEAEAEEYKANTENYNTQSQEILDTFDTGYSQQHSIMFVKTLEDIVGAWVNQIGLSESNMIYTFGQVESSNPFPGVATTEYTSDYVGFQTTLTLSYQCSYDQFKDLIKYLNSYKYKLTIDSMSMTYNSASDVVSGSLVVSQYAVTGSDREFSEENFGALLYGTGNIFQSEVFNSGTDMNASNGDNIISDYDFYISMNYAAKEGNITVGAKSDVYGTNTATSTANEETEVEIRFFMDGTDYYVQYAVGDVTYPKTQYDAGAYFIPGDELDLLIMSSERDGDDDKLTANVTITNETDMTLYVKVVGEDTAEPRFVLDKTEGDIVIYR